MAHRRELIAEAGMRLIAREGLRSLTHRKVDAALDLPAGSTSYYARTHRDLVLLVTRWLTDRVTAATTIEEVPALTPEQAAQRIAGVLDGLLTDPDEQHARLAILTEYRDDDEVHAALMLSDEFAAIAVERSMRTLTALGVPRPEDHAVEALQLLDALLLHRLVARGSADARSVLASYYRGLLAGS